MTATAKQTMTDDEQRGKVIQGRFRIGTRLQVPEYRSWIILLTRQEMIWTRVRGVVGAVAIFAAGVVSAGVIWR